MVRSRNIKPGFFKNELLAEMPAETRLLFMGLWCLADREGRFEDRPKKIKMELFPCDSFSIEDSLALLSEGGFLLRYEVLGKRYAQVVNFTKHQMPHHKEVPSVIPAPHGCAQVTRHSYDVPAKVREEVFARDGNACLRCGSLDILSLDHIHPLASGGDNSINNLQTLCTSCNSSKGNTIKDYRKGYVDSTSSQRKPIQGVSCPSDSLLLIPDSLIPESKTAPAKRAAPIGFTPPNWINLQHWQAWHSSPKRKKATNDQKQMAVDKLDAWRQNGEDFAGALENAAVGGYQGLFLPDKKPSQSGATETAYQRSMREKMEVMAPAIAAKAPGVPRTNPNNFFDALPNAKPLEITQ